MADMRGAIIGPALAEKYGWKIGSTFQLESFIPPYRADKPFEFVVRAIYDTDTTKYPNHPLDVMLFHWKYLYEKTGQRVGVGTYTLQIAQPEPGGRGRQGGGRDLREQRHADQDRDRSAVCRQASSSWPATSALILNAIGMAVAFTILLVTANTMSMAIRERRTEIAVLKTLGFPSALVLALVLGEALVIGLLGSGLGVLMGRLLIGNIGTDSGDPGLSPLATSTRRWRRACSVSAR